MRFVLPSDYVNWVKLYLFQGNTLRELTENIQVQSSIQYLQNSTAVFGYDGNNNVSTIESNLDTARKDGSLNSIYLNQNNEADENGNCIDCDGDIYNSRIGARYGLNTETANINPAFLSIVKVGLMLAVSVYGLNTETANINPTFTIDKKAGVINFDSTMANRQCVLQYISDGMENGDDSQISVNKLFEDYIYAYIQYAILNSKFGVQEYIINRARKNKQALLRNAKIRLSNIHPSRLLMNLRGEDKWIK